MDARRAGPTAPAPGALRALLADGLAAHRSGDLASAERRYADVLAADPGDFEALQLMGALRLQQQAYAEAAASLERAIQLRPSVARLHFNLGLARLKLDRPDEALAAFDRAIALRAGYAEAHNSRGNALALLNRHEEALASYQASLALRGAHAPTLLNVAAALFALGRFAECAGFCRRALGADPGSADARAKLGLALYREGRYEDAERELVAAGEAIGFGFLGHFRQRLCAWSGFDAFAACVAAWRAEDAASIDPFVVFGAIDDPAACQRAARRFAARTPSSAPVAAAPPRGYGHARARIAYLSTDFHAHATSVLAAGLFEQHDRRRFEIVAVSCGRPDGSALEARLRGGFDRWIDARGRSDRQVAQQLRELEIDVAVDLKGHTAEGRPGILALRPAPLQVGYLGYPGTLGAPWVDYLVADEWLIPIGERAYYDESVVYLPDSYQVNDRARPLPTAGPGRAACGLPEDGFAFCSFNNSYKITPEVFSTWMRLLAAVPGSVLWLLEDSATAAANLRREAEARGVGAQRLVFAPRLDLAAHLARHRHADLFLDTFPCNAHTTASDALWSGLPLVTQSGRGFAARVAGSLLRSAGLAELVTRSLPEYAALALELASNPARLAGLRARLERGRLTMPLFDTARFTRGLEAAYAAMLARRAQGLAPADLRISAGESAAAEPAT